MTEQQQSMAIASSSELRPGPHKKQENTPIAYAQKDAKGSPNSYLFSRKLKEWTKSTLHFCFIQKNVGSEDHGPDILQGKNEREGIK